MSTLVAFLLARIAEDEDAARSAGRGSSGDWRRSGLASIDAVGGGAVIYSDAGQLSTEVADQIARQNPARVLAECEAKRQIVDLHSTRLTLAGPDRQQGVRCRSCSGSIAPCRTLIALVQPYASHSDFQDEWRA